MKATRKDVPGREFELSTEWKYIAGAFLMTVVMTFIMVLMLPDTPFEFW